MYTFEKNLQIFLLFGKSFKTANTEPSIKPIKKPVNAMIKVFFKPSKILL